MRELAERAYFRMCLALGWLFRSAKYSNVRIIGEDGGRHVRKSRSFYAPLLVSLSRPLIRILNTGVRVLGQRDWEARERTIYQRLGRSAVRIEIDGTLVLPCLAGQTLATLLEDAKQEDSIRMRAIEQAVVALAEFHRLGFTHADAMAENVIIDPETGAAHWFDFETVHDAHRPMVWRRADDVRALVATCLIRTLPSRRAEMLQLVLDVYQGVYSDFCPGFHDYEDVVRLVAESFTSAFRRPLTFHLAQARLSFQEYREICRALRARRKSPRRRL